MGYRKDNMKKTLSSLLTIFGLCILSVGCSDEDTVMKTIDEEIPVSFDGRFCLISDSKNQVKACYPLHGTQYNPEERLWTIPAADIKEEVNLGNGQTEIQIARKYYSSDFFPNTHTAYSLYGLCGKTSLNNSFILIFYDENGESVKESSPVYDPTIFPIKCPWDENSLIMANHGYTEDELTEDTIFFYNQSYEEKKLIAPLSLSALIQSQAPWHKGDDSHYLVDFTSVTIKYAENRIYTKEFDIKGYLKKKYPNETNEPSCEIKNIDIVNAYIIYTIEVTFHNGNKENITIKINSKNGQVVE